VVEESDGSGTDGYVRVWQILDPMAIQSHGRGSRMQVSKDIRGRFKEVKCCVKGHVFKGVGFNITKFILLENRAP